ncbi:MAG: hypothetical protein INQ03_08265 [Candidatus Heimdallarchaeota archaeon]|nr:hypothetical protein [Candidatus Heimdallarchaeota archaeon]
MDRNTKIRTFTYSITLPVLVLLIIVQDMYPILYWPFKENPRMRIPTLGAILFVIFWFIVNETAKKLFIEDKYIQE